MRESNWIAELMEFVSIPNNVYIADQIRQNANYLKGILEKRNIRAEILETPTNRPLVYGELLVPGAHKTVLIYSHYDGVPAEASEWNSDPYLPIIKEGRIFGRSVADSKNAIIASLAALDILHEKGIKPKVNIKFLFDGEEEVESPSLKRCLEQNKERFNADVVIAASGETHQSGLPTIELGFRGILQFSLTVYTGMVDLHSGHFGNFFPNAAFHLSSLIASMKNQDGMVTIKGFYEDIAPLSYLEKDLLRKIPNVEKNLQTRFGFPKAEMAGLSLQELINLPTLNVRGLSGGYVGENARNSIPSRAVAEFDVRLVKGMTVDHTLNVIKNHIQAQGWTLLETPPKLEDLQSYGKIAEVEKKAGFPATRTNAESFAAQYVIDSVKQVFGEELVILPSEGGSLPLYIFEEQYIPVIGLPTSNFDCNQHTHDENLRIDYFHRAIKAFASLFSNTP